MRKTRVDTPPFFWFGFVNSKTTELSNTLINSFHPSLKTFIILKRNKSKSRFCVLLVFHREAVTSLENILRLYRKSPVLLYFVRRIYAEQSELAAQHSMY